MAVPSTSLNERVARLEIEVELVKEQNTKMLAKLDDLLTLRNRGMGAFWLASALTGTGIIGFLASVVGYFKHG